MASIQQGEKQLFEKFWMGTFKAVATPRRESIIVASITSRKPLSSDNVKCSSSPNKETRQEKLNVNLENGGTTERLGREFSPRQHHSDKFPEAEQLSPSRPLKGKKKKKKSDRKKRKRLRSYSPSPVKKKKKKSSKKQKRNRSSSKKRRHSSRGRPRKSHHHHYQHSRSSSTESRSLSCENRAREQPKEERHRSRRKKHKYHNSRSVNKKQREVTPISVDSSICPSKLTISQSVPGLLVTAENHGGCQKDVSNEYDSGNDICTPPSMQTSSSVLKNNQDKESPIHQGYGHVPSSAKTPNGHSDNISDSGNSSASCFSFSKASSHHLEESRTPAKRDLSSCLGCLKEHKSVSDISPDRHRSRSSSYKSTRRSYSRSSSHSISSYSSYYRSSSDPKSRSRSISSGRRSYSRSPSYSPKSARKSTGSRNSRTRRSPSYSRYSPSRVRERSGKYDSAEKETRKGGQRARRSSYSPMKKRRRDSPSHLEARRITSARKRPIPYYRPSPSSSSSDSSTPSWYSLRSRSRSRSYFSHRSSRSRSHSSRSRSRDWNRSSWEHSRSRSRSWSRSSDSCDSIRR
ncbi:serine/arginine repetitive matrix protein 4 isoform X2 [Dendrobates tinctorius]|uniref:serine/arginine repetitive matrix protein 4 isoform X2 n=1 Tax=Dendrobates tinctorius TaxID=92724 RepID=UPI003CC9FEE6